jgi:hypothetical protein
MIKLKSGRESNSHLKRIFFSPFSHDYFCASSGGSRPGLGGLSPPLRGAANPAQSLLDYSATPAKPAAGGGGGLFGAIANLLRPPAKKTPAGGGGNPNEPSYEFIQSTENDDAKVGNAFFTQKFSMSGR